MAIKTSTIQIRVTMTEKKRMQREAKRQGLPLSAWMRQMLLKKPAVSVLAGLVLLGACGSSPTRPTGATAATAIVGAPTAPTVLAKWRAGQPIRVVVLGASIALGCCADGWERTVYTPEGHLAGQSQEAGASVIAQVRKLVKSRNPNSVVVNESGDGYTAHRTLNWMDRWLTPTAGTPQYDLAFLPLAANDANHGNSPTEFTGRMQGIIDRLVAAGIVPVLVKELDIYGVPEARFGYPFRDYIAALDQLAARNRLSVVDSYTAFHAAVLAGGGVESCGLFFVEHTTGLHPNQAGHDLMFRGYEQWFRQ
jgi:lysophospholipase L1-like esterase